MDSSIHIVRPFIICFRLLFSFCCRLSYETRFFDPIANLNVFFFHLITVPGILANR